MLLIDVGTNQENLIAEATHLLEFMKQRRTVLMKQRGSVRLVDLHVVDGARIIHTRSLLDRHVHLSGWWRQQHARAILHFVLYETGR